MRGGTIAEVLASKNPKFPKGTLVQGQFGWQQYAIGGRQEAVAAVHPPPGVSPSVFLGALGLTGMTGYFGLLRVGLPKAGETVVVSAAAGATGSIVAQIAKNVVGCRVVGIAGGPEKCKWLVEELGLDAVIDYKRKDISFRKQLKSACPNGLDIFFDNVGGEQLDAALANLAPRGARVVICGAISRYNASGGVPNGPSNYMNLLINRARMEGFVVFDYAKEYPTAVRDIAQWMAEGKVKMREDIVRGGLEQAPNALLKLFAGENTGKLVVEIVPGSHDQSLSLGSKL